MEAKQHICNMWESRRSPQSVMSLGEGYSRTGPAHSMANSSTHRKQADIMNPFNWLTEIRTAISTGTCQWSNVIGLVDQNASSFCQSRKGESASGSQATLWGGLTDIQRCSAHFKDPPPCFSNMYFPRLVCKSKLKLASQAWNERRSFSSWLQSYFS